MHQAFKRAMRVGAAVILGMFAAVILFLLLAGCSSLSDDKGVKSTVKVSAEGTITRLEVECGADYEKEFSETETLPESPPAQ